MNSVFEDILYIGLFLLTLGVVLLGVARILKPSVTPRLYTLEQCKDLK